MEPSMELDHHACECVVLSDLSVSVAFSWIPLVLQKRMVREQPDGLHVIDA